MNRPLDRLRHHVTGAIERGEAQAIVEVRAFRCARCKQECSGWDRIPGAGVYLCCACRVASERAL